MNQDQESKMIVRNWMNCPSRITHGYMIERVVLTKGKAGEEGAIMKHIDSFSRAYLESYCTSTPATHDNIQEVFYIVNGEGVFKAGDEARRVTEGDGVIVPPGVPHFLKNELDEPLEFLILVESVEDGVETLKEAVFRNYRESSIGQGHWNHLVHNLFVQDDGLVKLHSVLVVRMEAMQVADTHGHNAETDEIWYMMRGSGLHVVNREVCRQKPGDAVPVAPSTGHCLINDTDQPLQIFYFAQYER
jgi:mannose-6-phosphate isomerase-like protein (cupin superfamily)